MAEILTVYDSKQKPQKEEQLEEMESELENLYRTLVKEDV